jgi:formylmethanofuran dehydrogenase subunit C
MMHVTITMKPRSKPFLPIEAEQVIPENFIGSRRVMVYEGNKERNLADLCVIRKDGNVNTPENVTLVLRGDWSRVKRVGEYMSSGVINIEGDIGMHCGNFMRAGHIEIRGNADAWLGREMRGGTLVCQGNARDYCGSGYRGEKRGMRGGSIEVMGDVGEYCGECLTGGSIIVRGNAGCFSGVEMRGGTLTIYGDATLPAANMVAGKCVVKGEILEMVPTFELIGEENGMMVYRGDVANRGKGTLVMPVR